MIVRVHGEEGLWLLSQSTTDISFHIAQCQKMPPWVFPSPLLAEGSEGGGRGWRSPLTSSLKLRAVTHQVQV